MKFLSSALRLLGLILVLYVRTGRSVEKTYKALDTPNILSQQEIYDEIKRDPLLKGTGSAELFFREAKNAWRIMKKKKKGTKATLAMYQRFLNICFSRFKVGMRYLPADDLHTKALAALSNRAANAKERNAKRKNKMLCTVLLKAYDMDMSILHANLQKTAPAADSGEAHCEWLIVFLGGEDSLLNAFYEQTGTGMDIRNGHANIGSSSARTEAPSSSSSLGNGSYPHVLAAFDYKGPRAWSGSDYVPKQMWYPLIVPYTSEFQRVWLLDADISVAEFDFEHLQWTLRCGKYGMKNTVDSTGLGLPSGPIIVQPLIKENTQYFRELNQNTYFRNGRRGHPLLAYKTRFIEQQAPLFQADFFEWYVGSVVLSWLPFMLIMESTWGFDTTWCGAAEDYILFHHSTGRTTVDTNPNPEASSMFKASSMMSVTNGTMGRPYGCAVLISTSPISHLKKESKKSGMTTNKYGDPMAVAVFYMTGHVAKQHVHTAHRPWSVYGDGGWNGMGRPKKETAVSKGRLNDQDTECYPREPVRVTRVMNARENAEEEKEEKEWVEDMGERGEGHLRKQRPDSNRRGDMGRGRGKGSGTREQQQAPPLLSVVKTRKVVPLAS